MNQSLPASTQFPADWYDDPNAPGGRVKRFWDGIAWTDLVYDLGIDVAVPAPGPTNDKAASVTTLHPSPEQAEVEVVEETASDRPEEAPGRRIGLFGARKAARQLAQENDELQRQMSKLTATVARYEAVLDKARTAPLD
jgi:hypothetical protein